jgi:presenilin-like A22 family membrane protease
MTKKIKKKVTPKNISKEKEESWVSKDAFFILAIIFLTVQTIGLYIAKQLFLMGMAEPMFGTDINDVSSAFYLFLAILIVTGIILVILKLRKTRKLLWLIEAMAIFSTTIIVLGTLIPNDAIVIAGTILIMGWRYTHRKSILFRTFVSMIAITGAGALIGISFGILPILAFITLLAIYDIIAVFYTKHMVEIGRQSMDNNYAFTVAIPTKKHTFELGNGDLVIPLAVASSILVNGAFTNNGLVAGLCLGASFLGIISSIYMVAVKKIPLPALPPQTLFMLIVIISAIIIGA